jgi:hypothetical protein
MNKLLILLTFTLLLTSCFGWDDANVEIPQVENTVQEETVVTEEANEDAETVNTEESEDVSSGNDTQGEDSSVREPVANEDVEIREAGTENKEYDVRANIENDPEASVVTEETLVVPTEPRAEQIQVESELSPEEQKLADEVLLDILGELVDDQIDFIEENE